MRNATLVGGAELSEDTVEANIVAGRSRQPLHDRRVALGLSRRGVQSDDIEAPGTPARLRYVSEERRSALISYPLQPRVSSALKVADHRLSR